MDTPLKSQQCESSCMRFGSLGLLPSYRVQSCESGVAVKFYNSRHFRELPEVRLGAPITEILLKHMIHSIRNFKRCLKLGISPRSF